MHHIKHTSNRIHLTCMATLTTLVFPPAIPGYVVTTTCVSLSQVSLPHLSVH